VGRIASSADNAAVEWFFAPAPEERAERPPVEQPWPARREIVTWIARTYHRRRRQRALGRLTPVESETLNPAAHAARNTTPEVSIERTFSRPTGVHGGVVHRFV
jgi:transposase InsO family protein